MWFDFDVYLVLTYPTLLQDRQGGVFFDKLLEGFLEFNIVLGTWIVLC